MSQDLFKVTGAALLLKRNPELTELGQVKASLLDLVEQSPEGAGLDLTAVSGISSTTVGMAVAAHLRAVESGRKLTIAIKQAQKRLFDLTMLTKTLSLEVVDAPPGGGSGA